MTTPHIAMFLKGPPSVRRLGITSDMVGLPEWWVQPDTNWGLFMFMHRGRFELDGTTFDLEPHDVVLVRPGARCRVYREDGATTLFFFFRTTYMTEEKWYVPVHARLGEEGPHWERLMRLAIKLLPFTLTSANSFLSSLLWSLAASAPPRPRNSHVARAEELVMARMGRAIKVSEIARDLNLSQSQLDRVFAAELGTTPLQFVLECRTKAAVEALRSTTKPLKEVALDCGFPDLQAFSRFVKARVGKSPREVRLEPNEPFASS